MEFEATRRFKRPKQYKSEKEQTMANEMDLFRELPTEVRDLFGTSRRLNRFFDDIFEKMPTQLGSMSQLSPKCEVQESEDHYVLCAEMPGVPKENINIEIRGNYLHISGARQVEVKGRKGEPSREEYGSYEQVLTLPRDVDTTRLEAEYKDGVLYVAIPKGESQSPRKIEIGSGEGVLAKSEGR